MGTAYTLPPEPRPSDFSTRFRRSRQRGIGHCQRRKARGRVALALLGAVALPAFAQPSGWDRFHIGNAQADAAVIVPMPFEQAGMSFPGSAFYYLDEGDTIITPGTDPFGDPLAQESTIHPRAVARPMVVDNSGVDRTRAEQCLAAAIYYEAASESDAGQRAVAQVVLNRVAHPAYPNSVCGVVYQGSERSTGCQFSFTCDGSLARKPSPLFWNRALTIAREALSGHV
ncbi:MAG: cell wall hydrolase, partial [Novosphingobium sp.]|nr:cell wall hydrolase [Novosphingobium sp.]